MVRDVEDRSKDAAPSEVPESPTEKHAGTIFCINPTSWRLELDRDNGKEDRKLLQRVI